MPRLACLCAMCYYISAYAACNANHALVSLVSLHSQAHHSVACNGNALFAPTPEGFELAVVFEVLADGGVAECEDTNRGMPWKSWRSTLLN